MLKASVFVLLLVQSMLSQAELTDVGGLSPDAEFKSGGLAQQQPFPGWPERQQSATEMIPPPPPGPYVSSALSDFSVEGPPSGRDLSQPVIAVDASNIPMETFSPDRPWPEYQADNRNTGFVNQRMPEGGYRYIKPPLEKRSYQRTMDKIPPNGNYGYRSAPGMNFPGMNTSSSRWMPSMGMNPGEANAMRPYSMPPNYDATYNKSTNHLPVPGAW